MLTARQAQNGSVLCLALASLGLWTYTALHPKDMTPFLAHGSYYAMFTLVLAWVYTLVKYLEARAFSAAAFLRQSFAGLLFCLVATLFIYFSVKPSFKTLGDETNLLSTSHAMVFGKKGVNELLAVRSFGNFDAFATAIDQRPFLFPFLVSLLHTVRGYGAANAFLLNAGLMFLSFAAVYLCARRSFNASISAAAVFLVASYPIFSISGTSGGFDLLACFCLGLSMIVLYAFLQNPAGDTFGLLWVTLLLLANTRYESFIFFFVILGLLGGRRRVKGEFIKDNRVLIAMTPLWFLIIVWSRLVNSDFINDTGARHIFGLSSLRANLMDMLTWQLDFRFLLPFNNILNLLSFALLLYLFVVGVLERQAFQKPTQRLMAFMVCVAIGLDLIIVLSHYAGAYASHTNARYYLPFSVACALVPLFWLETVSEETRSALSTPLLLGSIALFALYHPIAVEGRFINQLGPNLEIYFAHDYLEKTYPDKNVLVIAEWPTEYTALEYGAMSFYTANAAVPRVLAGLERHLYHDIIVVQQIPFATQAPVPEEALSPAYALETVSEYETAEDRYIRISKVRLGS